MSDETTDSLTDKADAAFRQVAVQVIKRARQTGTPVIVWEDGRMVDRTPDEMEQKLAAKLEQKAPPPTFP
jgi:hypothetical protein